MGALPEPVAQERSHRLHLAGVFHGHARKHLTHGATGEQKQHGVCFPCFDDAGPRDRDLGRALARFEAGVGEPVALRGTEFGVGIPPCTKTVPGRYRDSEEKIDRADEDPEDVRKVSLPEGPTCKQIGNDDQRRRAKQSAGTSQREPRRP